MNSHWYPIKSEDNFNTDVAQLAEQGGGRASRDAGSSHVARLY